MYLFDETAVILDDLIEELPDGIVDKLNGGINLIEEEKKNDYGDYVYGKYHSDEMGKYIELYYGSLVASYGELDQDAYTDEIRKVLKKELTRHFEHLTGTRIQDKLDEENAKKEKWKFYNAQSVLFVDSDGSALGPMAVAMFRKIARGNTATVAVSCACTDVFAGDLLKGAATTAGKHGLNLYISEPIPTANEALLSESEVVLCMDADQANDLIDRYPDFEEKILCLSTDDIKVPKLGLGWEKTYRKLENMVERLVILMSGGFDE